LLAGKRVLVLLDNAVNVGQVRPLLPGTAGCVVLLTSRSRLSGLVAQHGAHRVSLGVLSEEQAVELLQGVTDGYRPADDPIELRELAELCARLPLALRIAAERAASRPHMPLRTLISELRDESTLWDALTAGDDDESDAVRTVFAWSYRALHKDAGRLFRMLGLHPGTEFDSAAAATLAGMALPKTRRLLDDLVGAHLLEQMGTDRFQFHDLLRAYATDQARLEQAADDPAAAIRRLVQWYAHSARSALDRLLPQGRQVDLPVAEGITPAVFRTYAEADGWFHLERRNLVAVIALAQRSGLLDLAWRLPALLRTVYARHHMFADWIHTGEIALRAVRALGDRAGEAEILESLGKAKVQTGALHEGIELHRDVLAIRRQLGDRVGEVSSLNAMGLALLRARRLTAASDSFEQCLRIAGEVGSDYWTAIAMNNIANVHLENDRWDEAETLLRRALPLFRVLEDRVCEGDCLHALSRALRGRDRTAEALTAIEQALDIARSHEFTVAEANWLVEAGRVQVARRQTDQALSAYQRSAALQRRLGDRVRESIAFDATGEAYRDTDRHEDAAHFHRLAVVGFRESQDGWLLARALVNLGRALRGARAEAGVRECLTEALLLLAEFEDPQALDLRRRAEGLLAEPI
jgi:tetratricopeptide (TPR) repeat protein